MLLLLVYLSLYLFDFLIFPFYNAITGVVAPSTYERKINTMKEFHISPDELFSTSDSTMTIINGIQTTVLNMSDEHGNFLAIPATDYALSDICGKFVLGKLIKEIDYMTYKGHVAVIKAYY